MANLESICQKDRPHHHHVLCLFCKALAAKFSLPADMTPNALLAALNIVAGKEAYKAAVTVLFPKE